MTQFTSLVQPEAVSTWIASGLPAVILDCRFDLADPEAGAKRYAQQHIQGAYYLDLDRDLSSPITPESGRHPLPDPNSLADRLGEAGVTPETQVFVYDDLGGLVAARAWWLLRWLGHPQVAVVDGGYGGLVAAGLPVDDRTPEPAENRFLIGTSLESWVSVGQLEDLLDEQLCYLIDVRAPERFRGEVEPLDPVAGHVPGAVNIPLSNNLEAGRFRSDAELRAVYAPHIESLGDRTAVLMCGSGVTACHTRLAMEVAGISNVSIYPGSWSEWIRDPGRAVATAKTDASD